MTVILYAHCRSAERVFTGTMENDFILGRVFRDLAARADRIGRLIDALTGMYSGSLAFSEWAGLFTRNAAAIGGGLDDYLAALRYRVDTGEGRGLRAAAVFVTFETDDRAEILVRFDRRVTGGSGGHGGSPGPGSLYLRFVAIGDGVGPGGWRVASIGVNPASAHGAPSR